MMVYMQPEAKPQGLERNKSVARLKGNSYQISKLLRMGLIKQGSHKSLKKTQVQRPFPLLLPKVQNKARYSFHLATSLYPPPKKIIRLVLRVKQLKLNLKSELIKIEAQFRFPGAIGKCFKRHKFLLQQRKVVKNGQTINELRHSQTQKLISKSQQNLQSSGLTLQQIQQSIIQFRAGLYVRHDEQEELQMFDESSLPFAVSLKLIALQKTIQKEYAIEFQLLQKDRKRFKIICQGGERPVGQILMTYELNLQTTQKLTPLLVRKPKTDFISKNKNNLKSQPTLPSLQKGSQKLQTKQKASEPHSQNIQPKVDYKVYQQNQCQFWKNNEIQQSPQQKAFEKAPQAKPKAQGSEVVEEYLDDQFESF